MKESFHTVSTGLATAAGGWGADTKAGHGRAFLPFQCPQSATGFNEAA